MDLLGLKQKELVQYAFLDSVKGQKNKRILFGLDNTIVNFKNKEE